MAKLRLQVLVLTVCLIGVVMAKQYVGKLAAQANATKAEAGEAMSSGLGVVEVP
jgi:hypothetical protein